MTQKMRKIGLMMMGLGMMAITLSFQSCWDDDDDCPRHVICPVEQPNALVTVKPNADNTAFRMQLNDSTQLWPVNMRQSPFGSKEVRALVNYRKPTEEELEKGGIFGGISCVYVNWIDSILTKPMIEGFGSAEENLQKYGSDPLEIIDDWVTLVEDGYLTLRIRTRWGGNVKHIVNLVHRTDVNTPNYFTLYHNAKGDVNGRVGDAIVAFKLADWITAENHSGIETLTLEWQSYSGTKTAQFKFRPHGATSTDLQTGSWEMSKEVE
jgi:hypothetical protein